MIFQLYTLFNDSLNNASNNSHLSYSHREEAGHFQSLTLRIQFVFLFCVLFCNIVSAWIWLRHPLYVYRFFLRFKIYRSRFSLRYIDVDGVRYRVAERGKPNPSCCSFLFIHGFSGDLTSWCEIAQHFDVNQHIVAVDLPGHGYSEIAKEQKLDFQAYTSRLADILDFGKVFPSGQYLHVVGQSMGGAVAGLLAAHWPHRVHLVTMMCPAVDSGVDSELSRRGRKGDFSWLVPKDVEELRAMLRYVRHNPMNIPNQMLLGFMQHRSSKNDFYLSLMKSLAQSHNSEALADRAADIKCPSQIIWGQEDSIIPVDNAMFLQAKLPNCRRLEILKNVGHSLNAEAHEQVYKLLVTFQRDWLPNMKKID